MKQIKNFLIATILLLLLIFATGCGINQNLGASMLQTNETEESSAVEEAATENDVAEDYDVQEEQQADQAEEDQINDDRVVTVILNTNKDRKRIHIENRSCSNKIGANNKQEWTGTADELIEFARKYGYVACGSCHPEKELDIDLPTN